MAITLLDFGSSLATVFFGKWETQTDSSIAIQSGAPDTSNTVSALSSVIAIRTPGAFTPGLGGRAGFWASAKEDRRIGTTMSSRTSIRIMATHLSKNFEWTQMKGCDNEAETVR